MLSEPKGLLSSYHPVLLPGVQPRQLAEENSPGIQTDCFENRMGQGRRVFDLVIDCRRNPVRLVDLDRSVPISVWNGTPDIEVVLRDEGVLVTVKK